MIPRNRRYGPGIVPLEEICVEKMREKSSEMTDFACLGRSTELLERNVAEFFGFCSRISIPSSKKKLSREKFILKEFAGKFGTRFLKYFLGVGYKIDAPSCLLSFHGGERSAPPLPSQAP